MTATLTTGRIRCGNRQSPDFPGKHTHDTVTDVRACYETTAAYERYLEWDDGAQAAEQAYERYLEDRGYEAARAQDDYEASHGVVGFSEAWHNESPETCPCGQHPEPKPSRGWWSPPTAAWAWSEDGRDLNT